MKRLVIGVAVMMSTMGCIPVAHAAVSEVDMLLDLMVKKSIINSDDAAAFRAEVAMKKAEVFEKPKPSVVPDSAQNIKIGGDVRVRTQGDWGKTTGTDAITKQRIRERVRGRFFIEGKANDFVYAGARLVGGSTNPRSMDDTLEGYFGKENAMFDQYYVRLEAPKEMVMAYGAYFSDLKLWGGRYPNPYAVSDMMWDPDITPGGVAVQYVSSDIRVAQLPSFRLYANIGLSWLDESGQFNTDPILYGYQTGLKTEPFGAFATRANISAAFYDFANLKGKTPANSSNTNSRTWAGDYGYGINVSQLGTYKYEYNLFDLMVAIDNEQIMDYAFPHGLYSDFIYNAGCREDSLNKALQCGAYLGKKKLKDVGDWKVSTEWRYLERDSVPDFLPDSNFYGFGTYTSTTVRPNVNGFAVSGGTNTKGIKTAFEYQLFKNTALNFAYMWMKPIKSWDKRDPWNEFLADVIVKF